MTGSESLRVVVGIGNPGREYTGTRHNLGFEAVAAAADRADLKLARPLGTLFRFGRTRWAAGTRGGRPFLLLQPQTYVNRTGAVVAKVAAARKVEPAEFFVICDDLNIPPGRLRIRRRGSDGGHKGLRSVGAALGTDGFPRLRLGIGSAPDDVTGFVLGRFTPDERRLIDEVLERTAQAILDFASGADLDNLMNEYNRQ